MSGVINAEQKISRDSTNERWAGEILNNNDDDSVSLASIKNFKFMFFPFSKHLSD